MIPEIMKKVASFCFVILVTSKLIGQEFKFSIIPTISNLSFFKDDHFLYSKARFGAGLEADYLFTSDNKIRFGIGTGIQNNHVRFFKPVFGGGTQISTSRAIITSLKFETYYFINDQMFVSFIPAFDYHFKHPKETIDDQTGLSLSIGLGNALILRENLVLNIEPRLTIHNIIPFKEKNVKYSLTTTGIRVGLAFHNKKN